MTIRDVFVPLFPSVPFEAQLQVAADLALQIKAHTNVVFTRPDPVITAALVPEMVAAAGVVAEAIETEGKRAQAAAFESFDQWRTAYGLLPGAEDVPANSTAAAWHERVGSIAATMVEKPLLQELGHGLVAGGGIGFRVGLGVGHGGLVSRVFRDAKGMAARRTLFPSPPRGEGRKKPFAAHQSL